MCRQRKTRRAGLVNVRSVDVGDFSQAVLVVSETDGLIRAPSPLSVCGDGLIDPRRDRGYVATWNAHSSLWRWPLDHVFHEGGFATVSIERLDAFGSDHFPYLVRLCRRSGDGPASEVPREAGDVAAANAVLSAAGATERVQAR